MASRKHPLLGWRAVIKASPSRVLVLVEELEIFWLNLMVPEFSLLGGIPCDFHCFFMSDPFFASRINCSIIPL